MATVGAVAAGLSGIVGAVGAVSSGKAQANAAEFNADVARQQAEQERTASRQEAEDFRREQSRLFARRRAVMGGSGVDTSTGSPLLASEDFASEAELGAKRIQAGGELRATRLSQQASLFGAEASNARTGGFMRAGSLLIGSAGTAATMWSKRPGAVT
jgi:hypothetical protein